jgi:hypothetical protein
MTSSKELLEFGVEEVEEVEARVCHSSLALFNSQKIFKII